MADFTRKRAILIGVDKYTHVNPLSFCGEDARGVAEAFRKSLQFKSEDILEFTLTSKFQPERDEIIHQLGNFLEKGVGQEELLVFYFSGHGMISERDQKDYLLPVKASPYALSETGISVEFIIEKLTKTGCKNIVMFIDACRNVIGESKGGAKSVMSIGESSREALSRDGIVTFFSCDPKERSWEIDQLKHGSFTYCVLEAIEKGECYTVATIDKYLRENVPLKNAEHQKPPQRPFTIIQPAEKGELAIFYRQIKPGGGSQQIIYSDLSSRLADLICKSELDQKCFYDAIELLERAKISATLNEHETRKIKFIESLLCAGKMTSKTFEILWSAAERQQSPQPPPKNL